ncbi:cupin domain-containing protein [Rhizobium sp. KVB221]|uniref:Cupin domain-containing protein n=1 Tax=Rhizobium setariae TaxID=2801340 RepID=A0A936YW07_9HYPH|nr:cupin domain-containing protein [Rhizobium setariae]MBL0374250.1 cupin domain-containing protein [Rhizobium setariae]
MSGNPDVVLIKPEATQIARQGMPQFFGISKASAGAKAISMNLTAFGPGGRAKAHYHRDFETAIYGISGQIALYYGERLEKCAIIVPGSFIYIPEFIPHIAFNLSDSEPATAITARNDAAEQENVILAPELEGIVDAAVAKLKAEILAARN